MPLKFKPRHVGVGTFRATARMKEMVNDVLDSGNISYGKYSRQFEQRFAQIHGCEYAILSNSGTSALQVALQALKEIHGWKAGDEVIVPATTFVATANIVVHNRMMPVFVDVDPHFYNIDAAKIEAAITERTRAIIPVHLFGQAADMSAIDVIAKRNNLKVIEDSCETMFVGHAGYPVGSWGDIGCFSTYVAHLVVTGVGGLSTTNNPDYAAKMRSLVNHGLELEFLNPGENFAPQAMIGRRFKFETIGHSYRITELEAALGVAQLEDYHRILTTRKRNAKHLSAGFKLINQHYGDPIQIPETMPLNSHAWMMYPVVLRNRGKEPLMAWLNERGVETRDMLPILGQPAYRYLKAKDYPVSAWLVKSGFYVGCHQDLDDVDIQYTLQAFEDYFSEEKRKKEDDESRRFARANREVASITA